MPDTPTAEEPEFGPEPTQEEIEVYMTQGKEAGLALYNANRGIVSEAEGRNDV